MSRLKLDIFSSQAETPMVVAKEERTAAQVPVAESRATIPEFATREPDKAESPKFIPVGFMKEDLLLLDQAVYDLRRAGHMRASKSGILRALISLHVHELQKVWIERRRN